MNNNRDWPYLQKSILNSIVFAIAIILFLFNSHSYAQALWTGTWDTSWQDGGAKMQLVQDGNKVTGTYEHEDGQISGEVFGNLLVGSWYESNGSGTFVFTISSDGKLFSGIYDDDYWWNGTKDIVNQSEWTGAWNTDWQGGNAKMSLVQKGNKVTGTYAYRGGRISGRISGNALTGNWYQDDGKGTFVFTISSDGTSFSGIYDDSQWWNGQKLIIKRDFVVTKTEGDFTLKWNTDGNINIFWTGDAVFPVTGQWIFQNCQPENFECLETVETFDAQTNPLKMDTTCFCDGPLCSQVISNSFQFRLTDANGQITESELKEFTCEP